MAWLTVISLALLAYTCIGYPALMALLAKRKPLHAARDEQTRPLSVILCVKNEAARIEARLDNLLSMDFPPELLEIIVVSDGSTDETANIVKRYAAKSVTLVQYPSPKGKAFALNQGIKMARHPYLLLCDARQTFQPDVAKKLVAYFADDGVGAVSGRLAIRPRTSDGTSQGLDKYWDMEVRLRADESRSGSAVGVSGAIYAMRKSCFVPLPEGTILDDVLIPMRIVLAGSRVLFAPEALAVDDKIAVKQGELNRKVRTLYGNLQLFDLDSRLFNPLKNPIWWRFISHKILRLFLPLMFAICCLSSLLARGGWFWFGALQLTLWTLAALSWRYSLPSRVLHILSAMFLLNLAIVRAWRNYLSGQDNVWGIASSNDPDQQGPVDHESTTRH